MREETDKVLSKVTHSKTPDSQTMRLIKFTPEGYSAGVTTPIFTPVTVCITKGKIGLFLPIFKKYA